MILFFIFLKQELRQSCKTPSRFLQNILFFVISCAIFLILSQNSQQNSAIFSIIWISLLFSILFSNCEFLRDDFRDGTLEQMIIFCENLETYIFAKMIAAWLIYCLPILLTLPFIMPIMGVNFDLAWIFFITAVLGSIAINFIAAFCGSLNIAGNKAPMIAILTMPLIIPILLICASAFVDNENVESLKKTWQILSALSIFSGTIAVLAATKIVRIVNE